VAITPPLASPVDPAPSSPEFAVDPPRLPSLPLVVGRVPVEVGPEAFGALDWLPHPAAIAANMEK
jgi:hypothetical protein